MLSCIFVFFKCPSPIIAATKKDNFSLIVNGILVGLEEPNLALTIISLCFLKVSSTLSENL